MAVLGDSLDAHSAESTTLLGRLVDHTLRLALGDGIGRAVGRTLP